MSLSGKDVLEAEGTIVYISLPTKCIIGYVQKLFSSANKALAYGSTTAVTPCASGIESPMLTARIQLGNCACLVTFTAHQMAVL